VSSAGFDAVVFDMDGVLIDSEPLWQDAEIEIFPTVGLHLTREMCRRTMGLRIDQVVRYWHEQHPWDEPSEGEMVRRVVMRVARSIQEGAELLPGAREVLLLVREKGLAAALASSSFRPLVDAVLDHFQLRHHFEAIVSGDEEPRGKPDPSIFLTAAARLDLHPDKCLAIEDSPNGIRAARAAGMTCVAILTPHASAQELHEADLILDSLVELNSRWDEVGDVLESR
jgi:HAD superfamily hydrolase (TIGR01509 family)